jgi:cupin fold WbuC family metalloprotein
MDNMGIPLITEQELREGLLQAHSSPRHRYPHILHKPGDEFNQVFNFITRDSYMQPHLHPGDEKIEEIFLVKGRVAVIYFDNFGKVVKIIHLKKEGVDSVKVPAFTWHTYVMLTEEVVTYETMLGKYDLATWKRLAAWAPGENMEVSSEYLNTLREKVEAY